ncbi:MAG: hypothetical protein ABJL67_15085 [Sulfitobacter sp.]
MESNGSYQDFLDSLRDFESGWDRERYNNGQISEEQLNTWAGGTANELFPQYNVWGDLNDNEWKAMSYTSMNTLGFVGYQFGEQLLIDLGYYDDTSFFGAGEVTNLWDGTWTGKNGVNSLDEFKTEAAQEIAIREAFGHNLGIIQEGLAHNGESFDDYLGTTRTFFDNGVEQTVELSLTGILAAAHLRGPFGTLNLLQNGSVSADEFGTSILRYIEQYEGFDAPSIDEMIEFYQSRVTGDEGIGGNTATPPLTPPPPSPEVDPGDTGANPVDAGTATHVLDWAWAEATVDRDFDPETDTILIRWFNAEQLDITETDAGVVFAIPSNNQSLTLEGVTLADLDLARITALDVSAQAELAALISGTPTSTTTPEHDQGNDDHTHDDSEDGHTHSEGEDGHDHMSGVMTTITLASESRTIDGFNPNQDMVHIEAGITDDRLQIFEENGDALGMTTRIVVLDETGNPQSTTILTGVGLSDLTMSNFSIAEQSAQNEIASAIGVAITTPGTSEGFEVIYDSDGSNPVVTTGATDQGGIKYRADTNADDIVGFDINSDQIDLGGTSVHGMIITKTPSGELALDSPWSNALQIVTGVQIDALTMDNFAIVGNEHMRQDLGGVMSWELGVGPREADTVYVRSHEYGVQETVDNFDPSTMKISFLYYGTRERLSVEDTDAGLVISTLPSGQSMTLSGITKADLIPGNLEFHHDQVIEDNLETPFGFSAEQVSLVSRADILNPDAPAGASTDGLQVRPGEFSTSNVASEEGGTSDSGINNQGNDTPPPADTATPTEVVIGASVDTLIFTDGVADTAEITWDWGQQSEISNFDTAQDLIDLNALSDGQLGVREADGNLYFEVVDNGGHSTALIGVQAEDLSASNLTADAWNAVLSPESNLMGQLVDLGFELA